MILSNDGLVAFHYRSYGIFFYNKIGSIISIGDLPTTNIIEPESIVPPFSRRNLCKIKKALLNCTPKVRQKKSNFWGVFIMKLTYEDKVQIYELRKQGKSFKWLSNRYGVSVSSLKYMMSLIDRYGIEVVRKKKNHYYSPELKQEMIEKVLLHGRSRRSVCIDYGIPN